MKRFLPMLLAVCMMLTTLPVIAAENVDANGSVQYLHVSDADALRDFIDNDGQYASQDVIATDWEGYTDVHKIVFDEPGTLYAYIFTDNVNDDYGFAKLELFADFALSARVEGTKEETGVENVTGTYEDCIVYEVNAGTYYYRGSRWNGCDPLTVTIYFGFKPASGKLKVTSLPKTGTTREAGAVTVQTVSAPTELNTYIANGGTYASQDVITTEWNGYSDYYVFTLAEPGWLFVNPMSDYEHANFQLFSNVEATSRLASFRTKSSITETPYNIYLDAGTYYYRYSRWNGYDPMTITTYLGFMPAANRLSVNNISVSADKTYATVTFNYDKNYLPSFISSGTLRMEEGKIDVRHIKNNTVWKTDARTNALETASVKITKNGTYTVRLDSNVDEFYSMVSFTVSGLNGTTVKAPAKPKSVTLTAGKKKVTIKWKKVTGATGYEIYRATSKNGKYTKIATIKKASTVKYVDKKSLKSKKKYFYKVRAYTKVGSQKKYSGYTTPKSVKVK